LFGCSFGPKKKLLFNLIKNEYWNIYRADAGFTVPYSVFGELNDIEIINKSNVGDDCMVLCELSITPKKADISLINDPSIDKELILKISNQLMENNYKIKRTFLFRKYERDWYYVKCLSPSEDPNRAETYDKFRY
jgi:hypothetical protein